MKKHVYLIAFCALPFTMAAQPVLQVAEDFNVGTTIRYMKGTSVAAGSAGLNQTWNFGSMTPISSTDTLTITYAFSNAYPGANLRAKTSDNRYEYINKATTSNSIVAIADSGTTSGNLTISYASNPALTLQRPMSYNLTTNDAFSSSLSVFGMTATGGGSRFTDVDGTGVLVLPTGTFYNTLRVKTTHVQSDTIPSPFSVIATTMVSYAWYDSFHKAPLFRIDSVTVVAPPPAGTTQQRTYMYLINETYPAGVPALNAQQLGLKANFSGQQLILNGSFASGHVYDVAVSNLSGQKIFGKTFTANYTKQTFELNSDLPAGIYLVTVSDASTSTTVKVVKE